MHFPIFPTHRSKVLRRPRKSEAKSYEVLRLSCKIILAHLIMWCSKLQPFSGNLRPALRTYLMEMSLVLRPPRDIHLCTNTPCLPWFSRLPQNYHVWFTFGKVQNLRLPRKMAARRPKVVWTCCVFNILTWKCASRHSRVTRALFNIAASKSGPKVVCF